MILASGSPRRRDFLQQIDVQFEVRISDVEEQVEQGEQPENFTIRMALMKARAVAEKAEHGAFVLGADTTVVLEDKILGKPRDMAHAAQMLGMLSAREHRVLTAVVLMKAQGGEVSRFLSQTWVRFRKLSDELIQWYIRTKEPMDKAGAYAIQGKGGVLVDSITGSYTNVVGLPLSETARMLERAGIWRLGTQVDHDDAVPLRGAGGV